MISYNEVKRGDILRVVGAGAPGFVELGDLVRVVEADLNAVKVENRHGKVAEFMYNCGAARLEATEWRGDFPEEEPSSPDGRVAPQ